ncbi:MAG: P-loop NTPase [Candidatus Kapabacteria bacterium]|nr:P-loop NTPase [Candidatus Kapabacteria bacterium]
MEVKDKNIFVITICSGKGGVGKSVLAANLAKILAQTNKVLVWDTNRYFPNQHILFGVEPPVRMKDVYSGRIKVEKAICRLSENLDLIADIPATNALQNSASSYIYVDIFEQIANLNQYDILIIDSPAGYSPDLLQICTFSDFVSVVITDEPTSLLDGYGLIKILIKYISSKKINIIVNNIIDNEDAEDIWSKLNMALMNFLKIKLDLIGYVPYHRIVRQSILHQELFIDTHPTEDVSLALQKAAEIYQNLIFENEIIVKV